jgi:hypothetical protein
MNHDSNSPSGSLNPISLIEQDTESLDPSSIEFEETESNVASTINKVSTGTQTKITWIDNMKSILEEEEEEEGLGEGREGTHIFYSTLQSSKDIKKISDIEPIKRAAGYSQEETTPLKPPATLSLLRTNISSNRFSNATKQLDPLLTKINEDFMFTAQYQKPPSYTPFLFSRVLFSKAPYINSVDYRLHYPYNQLYTTRFWQDRLQRRDLTSVLSKIL